jgi:exosortase
MRQESLIKRRCSEALSVGASRFTESQRAVFIVIGSCAVVLVLFWQTMKTMVIVWAQSRTFAHGFFVIPVCLYLAWCYRERLASLVLQPSRSGLIFLIVVAASWLCGHRMHSILSQQIAMLTMFPALVWATLGTEALKSFLFPLGFLAFALPIGTSVEPWLQQFTSAVVVGILHVAGIPLQWDGHLIAIPSKVWEVTPDCGGLRYVLPGLALAYVSAGILYTRPSRRLGFLLLTTAVLMVANGVRASMIILWDHLGIVQGADHRLFSYSIYGMTLITLFWIGLKWQERQQQRGNHCWDKPLPQMSLPHIVFRALLSVAVLTLTSVSVLLFSQPR